MKNKEVKTVYDGKYTKKRHGLNLESLIEIPVKKVSLKDNIKMNLDDFGTKLKIIGAIIKLTQE